MRLKSIYAWSLVLAVYVWGFFHYAVWREGIVNGGDTWGYYAYLPAVFVHGDLASLDASMTARKSHHGGYWSAAMGHDEVGEAPKAPNGNRILKYTAGVALLQTPFFLAGHLTAKIAGYPQDGYSLPYRLWVHSSLIFYALLGMWWLRRLLQAYFEDTTVAWLVLGLGLGTNLFYFSLHALSHAYQFCLYSLLLLATHHFYSQYQARWALLVGLAAGLIVLIRPVELIVVAIPLFYGWGLGKERRFREAWRAYLLAVGAFLSVGAVQLLYWKLYAGHWVYYSYGNERFFFTKPQIINGLWSYHNGLFAYTPLMYLALIGGLIFYWRGFVLLRRWWVLLPFLLLHTYITYSWWCWQYINGFGSRPMIDVYPAMAIFMGLLLTVARNYWLWGLRVFIVLCILLNQWQTQQHHWGVLWSEAANLAVYKRILFKSQLNYGDLVVYDTQRSHPEESKLRYRGQLYSEIRPDSAIVRVHRDAQYHTIYEKTAKESAFPLQSKQWLRLSAKARKWHTDAYLYEMCMLVSRVLRAPANGYSLWSAIRVDNKIFRQKPAENVALSLWGGEREVWGEVYFYQRLPDNLQPEDTIKVFLQNNSPNAVEFSAFRVDVFEEE